jgi:hypothetical protein
MDDAIPVLLEEGPDRIVRLGYVSAPRVCDQLRPLGEGLALYLLGSLAITFALQDATQPIGGAGAGLPARRGKRAIIPMVMRGERAGVAGDTA